jgi:hypothetical protein
LKYHMSEKVSSLSLAKLLVVAATRISLYES